jgi:hypothetical protein
MADIENVLERRAKAMAEAIKGRRDLLTQALAPTGQRPAFHEQLSKPAALAWWTQHRNDGMGKEVIARMKPESILELDNALAQHNQAQQFMGNDNAGF